jgi:hypothetical protein
VGLVLATSLALTGSAAAAEAESSLARDAGLSRAARQHAREVLADESRARPEAIREALASVGAADLQIVPFAAIGSSADAVHSAYRSFYRERIVGRGFTHFGLARAGTGRHRALVALFARRPIELEPLPPRVDTPSYELHARARGPAPIRAFLSGPRGRVALLPVERHGDRLRTLVPFGEGPGVYVFELLVDGPRGPEVASLWRVRHRVDRDPGPAEVPTGLPDDVSAALALLDRARARAEQPALRPDARLSRVAAAHARDVCAARLAAHVLPGGVGPDVRVRAAGHRGPVLENVALAESIGRAHVDLMESPSHRRNVLDPAARTVGVGVHAVPPQQGRGRVVCFVQLFGLGAQR